MRRSRAARRGRGRHERAFEPLRRAFEQRDIERLGCEYDRVMRSRLWLRAAARLVEFAYPVRAALAWAGQIEAAIAKHGLPRASRIILRRFLGRWDASISPLARSAFREGPTIFFGNHPSLLTPFLVAAQIERDDFRSVSTKYVCHLLPSFGEVSFPVEVPLTRPLTEWRLGRFRRALVFALVSLIRRVRPPAEVKAANRRSIQAAIDHVKHGGCIIICPDGGEGHRKDWYPGIGIIAKALAEQGASAPVRLVPFIEVNSSNRRVHMSLRRGPLAKLKKAWYARKAVSIAFGAPVLLSQVVKQEHSVAEIVASLFLTYKKAMGRP